MSNKSKPTTIVIVAHFAVRERAEQAIVRLQASQGINIIKDQYLGVVATEGCEHFGNYRLIAAVHVSATFFEDSGQLEMQKALEQALEHSWSRDE